ncbi:MAG: phosphotransferase [Dermatophilaceae bacterium]
MAEIHRGTWIRPTKTELLTGWMGAQRWYASKGSVPDLAVLAAWRLPDPAGEVGIETLLVSDSAGPEPVTYQVPLTYRSAPLDALAHALVGTMEHGVLGPRWVYDGAHDPVYAAALMTMIQSESVAESSSESDVLDDRFAGHTASSWHSRIRVIASKVLVGEQSNTSVILDTTDADGTATPIIVKIFRTLSHGDNPDVVLQSALREAGCARVPDVVGSVLGTWPSSPSRSGAGTDLGTGHLAFAQEFIPGSEDAWRVALRAASGGTDFTVAARELGAATADVHNALADALPTTTAGPPDIARITAVTRRRLMAASALVPEIAARADRIEAVIAAAESAPWPALQRIHGDYHLGQVLHSPDRGWLLLDFEGEPLRPLAERSLPDSPFRDIAGMLRSFDYAGGSVEHDSPGSSARAWVDNGVTAFLDGYASQGTDPRERHDLLRVFLLDKALYEVVYEARNRPTWLAIPVAAITRLLEHRGEHDEERGASS